MQSPWALCLAWYIAYLKNMIKRFSYEHYPHSTDKITDTEGKTKCHGVSENVTTSAQLS